MPSIRIKGQVYLTLDPKPTNDDTLSLRGELSGANPRNAAHSHTSNIQHRSSLPLLPRGQLDVPSTSSYTSGRPRSASGRVYTHCINTSARRNSLHSQPPLSPLLSNTKSKPTSNQDNTTTSQEIEGVLPDVRVTSHVDPSIVESSFDDEDSQISGHHHDDVVEHLDVIGIFLHLSPFSASTTKQFITDSQVGAVSNLTNAANSILM